METQTNAEVTAKQTTTKSKPVVMAFTLRDAIKMEAFFATYNRPEDTHADMALEKIRERIQKQINRQVAI